MKDLIEAVQFVSIVNKVNSSDLYYFVLNCGFIYSNAGSLIACAKFDGDFECAVDGSKLSSALNQCSGDLVLSDSKKGLIVKSGQFKAVVPILVKANTEKESLNDAFLGDLDQNFITGLRILNGIIKNSGVRLPEICVKVSNNIMIATDGKILIEYTHGCEIGEDILLSKEFVEAALKVKKPIKGFGFSLSTFTIYFEDESWLRGDTLQGKYPNISHFMAQWQEPKHESGPLLELGIKVLGFSDDGSLWVGSGKIASNELSLGIGANVDFEDPADSVRINFKLLRAFKNFITRIDIHTDSEKVFFDGPNLRGLMTKYKV